MAALLDPFAADFSSALSTAFEPFFTARLRVGGVTINNLFMTQSFPRKERWAINSYSAPEKAVWADEVGIHDEAKKIEFQRRYLRPKQAFYDIVIDEFDIARSGFDPEQLAEDAAAGCNRALDELILTKMVGQVESDGGKFISFKKEQYISYDYGTDLYPAADAEKAKKLTAYKILKAVEKMRINNVQGTIVAFASYSHLTDFMQDERVASTDFNTQPAMATGITTPYGGIQGFVPTEFLPSNIKAQKDNTKVDHIYVVGTEYMRVGTNFPWKLDIARDPSKRFNWKLQMRGAWDATRREEAGVVVIEVAHKDREIIV